MFNKTAGDAISLNYAWICGFYAQIAGSIVLVDCSSIDVELGRTFLYAIAADAPRKPKNCSRIEMIENAP